MTRAWHPTYGRANNKVGIEMWTRSDGQVLVAGYWGPTRTFAVVPAEEVAVGTASVVPA